MATGPIAWFLMAELVPTEVRSLCSSVALALNHVAAVLVTFAVLPLYDRIGSLALLVLFVLPCSLCLAYLFWRLPETRGRDIADIVRELGGDSQDDVDGVDRRIETPLDALDDKKRTEDHKQL